MESFANFQIVQFEISSNGLQKCKVHLFSIQFASEVVCKRVGSTNDPVRELCKRLRRMSATSRPNTILTQPTSLHKPARSRSNGRSNPSPGKHKHPFTLVRPWAAEVIFAIVGVSGKLSLAKRRFGCLPRGEEAHVAVN